MHVYRMQKLMELQGKQRVVNVRSRANLYQTVERLARLGLLRAEGTVRGDTRPDRTIYAVTEAGRVVAHDWLRQMLRTTGSEYPEFVAAMSVLFVLDPQDAGAQLSARADRLATDLAAAEAEIAANPGLPRLFLLEEEYRATVVRAELDWVRAVIEDLRAGRLAWDEESIRKIGEGYQPPEEAT